MARTNAPRAGSHAGVTFDDAAARVGAALALRAAVVEEAADARTLGESLRRLRERLRLHVVSAGAARVDLAPVVAACDRRTRADGFHVLHDWDGRAEQVNPETIPIDVLDYVVDQRGDEPVDKRAIAIVLDYYFVHLLALLALRVWDEGDADLNLDRVNALLGQLQDGGGSGQRFVADAETLILIATSHYEPHEPGFDRLLDKVRSLNPGHRLNVALGHAASMGSHLRFGFEATYARDVLVMRDDNVVDYPWLCFALATLMRECVRSATETSEGGAAEAIVEALLSGLSADVGAFVGPTTPSCLRPCEPERSELRSGWLAQRASLLSMFERFRPSPRTYSPLSFFFNFSHNVLKGIVIDALLWSEASAVSFNDLLTALPREAAAGAARERMATTLMNYARTRPDRIRGKLMPVIVYDPQAGHQAYAVAMRKLKE